MSGHQDKSSTDSASASELSIQSDSDHVGIDVMDLPELTVVEQRLNELQLKERGQEIFDLELALPKGSFGSLCCRLCTLTSSAAPTTVAC